LARSGTGFQRADGGSPAPRLYRLEGSTKVSLPFDDERIDDHSSWLQPIDAQPVGTVLVLEFEREPLEAG
jgi:hypothetical protein